MLGILRNLFRMKDTRRAKPVKTVRPRLEFSVSSEEQVPELISSLEPVGWTHAKKNWGGGVEEGQTAVFRAKVDGHRVTVKVMIVDGGRESFGQDRQRVLVMVRGAVIAEFIGVDDFETSHRLVSIIKTPSGKHISDSEKVPCYFASSFGLCHYDEFIDATGVFGSCAVIIDQDDCASMALFGLLRWIERRLCYEEDLVLPDSGVYGGPSIDEYHIDLVMQETENSCGQACLAMLAGVTWSEAVRVVGHDKRTSTKELVSGLRSLGLDCGDRLIRIGKGLPIPSPSIVSVNWVNGQGHWVVHGEDGFYDPGEGGPFPRDYYDGEGKVTSYLPVYIGSNKRYA